MEDQDDFWNKEQSKEPLSSLVDLPTELLVYILSFLKNIRDIVKLRYVSRRLQSVCETPSLWREFVWPHFNIREERCVKNLLESCGQHIKRLSFPDHVTPSKLTVMLPHCSNLVTLSIPTSKLNPEQLTKIIGPMEKLQSLDVPLSTDTDQLLAICSKLKELTIRVADTDGCEVILTKWVKRACIPQALNVVSTFRFYQLTQIVISQWIHFNHMSPTDHIGCFKVYHSLKVPMDLFPALPDLQLQFGLSSALPLVKASKYGLLYRIGKRSFITDLLQ